MVSDKTKHVIEVNGKFPPKEINWVKNTKKNELFKCSIKKNQQNEQEISDLLNDLFQGVYF